jgi:hypothetical protein
MRIGEKRFDLVHHADNARRDRAAQVRGAYYEMDHGSRSVLWFNARPRGRSAQDGHVAAKGLLELGYRIV